MSHHDHVSSGINTGLKYCKFISFEIFQTSVGTSQTIMSILGGASNAGEMLQTSCYLLLCKTLHHGCNKRRNSRCIRSVSSVCHNAVIHIGQICHRCKIQIKPKLCQVSSDRHACLIRIIGISGLADSFGRIYFVSQLCICHSADFAAFLIYCNKERIFTVQLGIVNHFAQLLCRLNILTGIDDSAYRILRQGILGSFSGLNRCRHTGNRLRCHKKQSCHLIFQRHYFNTCIYDLVQFLLRRKLNNCLFRSFRYCKGLLRCQKLIYDALLFLLGLLFLLDLVVHKLSTCHDSGCQNRYHYNQENICQNLAAPSALSSRLSSILHVLLIFFHAEILSISYVV